MHTQDFMENTKAIRPRGKPPPHTRTTMLAPFVLRMKALASIQGYFHLCPWICNASLPPETCSTAYISHRCTSHPKQFCSFGSVLILAIFLLFLLIHNFQRSWCACLFHLPAVLLLPNPSGRLSLQTVFPQAALFLLRPVSASFLLSSVDTVLCIAYINFGLPDFCCWLSFHYFSFL